MYRQFILGAVLGLACVFTTATPAYQPTSASVSAVYRCKHAEGSVTYTNVPAPGCMVLFTYSPGQWRVIAYGGRGAAAWKVLVNEAWRSQLPARQATIVWLFAAPKDRPLTGETYKAVAEHASAECNTSQLTLDHRTYFKDKPGGKALTPDDYTQTLVVPVGSPAAAIVHEFCS